MQLHAVNLTTLYQGVLYGGLRRAFLHCSACTLHTPHFAKACSAHCGGFVLHTLQRSMLRSVRSNLRTLQRPRSSLFGDHAPNIAETELRTLRRACTTLFGAMPPHSAEQCSILCDPGPHSTGKMGTRGPSKHRDNGDPPVKMGTPPTGNSIPECSSSVAV